MELAQVAETFNTHYICTKPTVTRVNSQEVLYKSTRLKRNNVYDRNKQIIIYI